MRRPRGGGGGASTRTGSPSTLSPASPASKTHRHNDRVLAADAIQHALRALGTPVVCSLLECGPLRPCGAQALGNPGGLACCSRAQVDNGVEVDRDPVQVTREPLLWRVGLLGEPAIPLCPGCRLAVGEVDGQLAGPVKSPTAPAMPRREPSFPGAHVPAPRALDGHVHYPLTHLLR